MDTLTYKRIGAVLLLFLFVLYAPFWLTFIFGIACMWYFDNFVEAVFLALMSDFLYGIPEARFYGFKIVTFVIFLVVFLIFSVLKKKVLVNGGYLK